jgi:pyrroline-5-carboxylate reductase
MILAVIGTGNMGQALLRAFVRQGLLQPADLRLFDVVPEKAAACAAALGAQSFATAAEAAEGADIVLLAVKPDQVATALAWLKGRLTESALLISIAAGVSLERLRKLAGPGPALARVMPNTPALVGAGFSAICLDGCDNRTAEQVTQLFASCGRARIVPEAMMDAVTGLSGSGPAYVLLMIEALADGGVQNGLPRDLALEMAAMTVLGAARLVLETGTHPAVLKDQVCSPGGTTIAAIACLEAKGLRSSLIEAVSVASARSRQLRGVSGEPG